MKNLFVILLLILFISCEKTGTISGKITNKQDGLPISNAEIIIQSDSDTAVSDSNGNFNINWMKKGKYTIIATHQDYYQDSINIHLDAGDTTTVDIALMPDHIVRVTGRILSEKKEPFVGVYIMISEINPEEMYITLKVGDNGLLANPGTETDSTGRFLINADRNFWAGTGYFTLDGGIIPGTMRNAGVLRGSSNEPIIIKTDSATQKVDLGEIIVHEKINN